MEISSDSAATAVRIEVVAEEERRVAVRRLEQARLAEVDEIGLVDRLEPEREPRRGERREHRHELTLVAREQSSRPKVALTRRLGRDLVPDVHL